MNALRPFFLLIGRASVFWLGALGLFVVSVTVAGLAADERLGLVFDPAFLALFAFPAAAGWLAGTVIQEFQHTSFAMVLPGVRSRIVSGFLVTGVAVMGIVAGAIALTSGTRQNVAVLFAVGLGAYCFGGILVDPLSHWITAGNVALTLFVVVSSGELSRFASEHPGWTIAVALGIGAAGFSRLFARATFRRKPFRATSPLPGRFSLERSRQYHLRRMLDEGARGRGWRIRYMGNDAWRWVRAAFYEMHGGRGWRTVLRKLANAWGLALIFVLNAWIDKGEMGFGEALAKSIHDALLGSPHHPRFSDRGGSYPVVALGIASIGAITALFATVALNDGIAYPLSRRQRARIHYRGGLVDAAFFLFVVTPVLWAVGLLAGWLVGYRAHFDFMPFFFRVLMVTLILMPLAYRGRLQLHAATRRRSEHTLIGVIVGIVAFVLAVCVATFVSPRLFGSPAVELAGLAAALLISQLLYRKSLTSYYRTADLA